MRCSVCGHATTDDAKFCAQCGTALSSECPECGHVVEPDARFSSECGTALAVEPEPRPADDLSRYVPEALLTKIRAALALLADALRTAARKGQSFVTGGAAIERRAWDDAEADLALGLQASAVSRSWERTRLLAGAAQVALERGDLEAAEAGLAVAATDADRMGMRLLACDIGRVRSEVATADGREDEAAAHRERREALIDDIAGEVADPELRNRLAGRLRGAPVSPREPPR